MLISEFHVACETINIAKSMTKIEPGDSYLKIWKKTTQIAQLVTNSDSIRDYKWTNVSLPNVSTIFYIIILLNVEDPALWTF